MINNMSELIDEMNKLESHYSSEEHKKEFQIYLPGMSDESEYKLKSHINYLPESYLKVAKKYNLLRVSIGWFSVWPGGIFESLDASIIDALNDPFFPKEFMTKHGIYQVGSCDTDLICVTVGTEQFKNGEVLFIEEGLDIYNPKDSQIHPIAKDFEQFLIIAGNLNKLQREVGEDDFNKVEKKQEFSECLENLEVDKKYHDAWSSLFG